MNPIEQFLLDSGFSWTFSKLLPYLFFPIIGLLIGVLFRKKMSSKKALRITIWSLCVILPFGGYFAYCPIYQGDFSNNSHLIKEKSELNSLPNNTLVVITIPNCPYCLEALYRMKELKKRNPTLEIQFLVCSNDSLASSTYQEIGGKDVTVKLATNPKQMAQISRGSFPSFAFTGAKISAWENGALGVTALDDIESRLK